MTIDAETIQRLVKKITSEHDSGYSDDTLAHFANEILNPPAPARFADRKTYDFAQVEGAMCVFDWMLTVRETNGKIDQWWDGLGSPGMRMVAIQAGDICDRAYKHMESIGYEFTDAYDFEFVPGICLKIDWDALCNDNQYDQGRYDPDIHAFVVAMITADKSANTDPKRRSFQRRDLKPAEYIAACRAEAESQWGYGDLVSDHAEKVTNAMEADEDPGEFIKWLGKKYDLTPRSELALA